MKTEEREFILIADDNPQNLQMLGNILRDNGYKVAVAMDGFMVLDFIKTRQPDCFLLDVMMPRLNGIETCRELKALAEIQDIPVIFITGVTDTWNKLQAFEAGGVDYITKPFQAEDVLARLKTHLMLRALRKQLQVQNDELQQEIAERQKAEMRLQETLEELQKTNLELQQVNVSKDKFFSIFSHDLKNSFALLLSYTNQLTPDFSAYKKEKLDYMVEIIRTTTNQTYALFENLLTWSRLQRGLVEPYFQQLSIASIVERSVNLLSQQAAQKQITLINAVQDKQPLAFDLKMIDAVIRNLLSNAIKFTRPGGTVTVSSSRDECAVIVMVADTGIGIPEATLANLFRIDTKTQRPGTEGETGTGLGLILCKDFIEKHGGTIWAESQVGQGTTFTFILPIAP